jgi:hypothetical protein
MLADETRQGKTYRWFEVQATEGGKVKMIMQMLVPADLSEAIEEVVIKSEGEPARRLPKETLRASLGFSAQLPSKQSCMPNMTLVGPETITVPAGTFRTSRFRDVRTGRDTWLSKDVPFGLIKGQMDDGTELVLSAYGTGASSSITEAPIDIPRP